MARAVDVSRMREQKMTPDLFDWQPPAGYPDAPGFKERTTSREAARKMEPRAGTLRGQVMTRSCGPRSRTA